MRFRAHYILLVAAIFMLLGACSQTTEVPTSPSSTDNQAERLFSSEMQSGHNLLGYWTITPDLESMECEVTPLRYTQLHLNVLNWLENGPCTNCLKITKFEELPNHDLSIEVTLSHPFPTENLSGFDVRGIAVLNGDMEFEDFGIFAPSILEDNPVLINADGHTTLYNPGTAGNGFQGYIKGKIAPPITPSGDLNGYKNYYTDENRHYFLAGDEITAEFVITAPDGLGPFGYAVDASWDFPTQPVSVPDSFPLTANCPEAYLIEVDLSASLATTENATTNMTIDVYDWQGGSSIQSVHVEGPYFWDGLLEASEGTGGPGTKRFNVEIINEFNVVGPGEYPVLIRVQDTESAPGAIIDKIGWKMFNVTVINNHPPECSAEVSNPEPDVGEEITFTDTSTDPEGPGDLAQSLWDFDEDPDFEVEGFVVQYTFNDPGIYTVNHKVIDQSGASDELEEEIEIDAGLFVTLQEDLDMKPIDRGYHFQSLDSSYTSGGIVDVDDLDGPWDFTTIGLTAGNNWYRIVDDSDSEVNSFVGDFNNATTHFIKYENMFDPFFPLLYQAEYHYFASDELYLYGFHDPYVIGSSPFGPPDTEESLAIPYPLGLTTDYKYEIVETGFNLEYDVKALGEGDVTVPYDGGTTYHCLLVRYRFTVSAPEPVNGGTLNFAFITDDGMTVANVIAVNDPPAYNWNTSTNKINSGGMTLFQALDEIVDE